MCIDQGFHTMLFPSHAKVQHLPKNELTSMIWLQWLGTTYSFIFIPNLCCYHVRIWCLPCAINPSDSSLWHDPKDEQRKPCLPQALCAAEHLFSFPLSLFSLGISCYHCSYSLQELNQITNREIFFPY